VKTLQLFLEVFAVTLGIGLGIATLFAILLLIARYGRKDDPPDEGKHLVFKERE
jgi:hypothetical protein